MASASKIICSIEIKRLITRTLKPILTHHEVPFNSHNLTPTQKISIAMYLYLLFFYPAINVMYGFIF